MASRLAIGVSVGTAALVAATFTGATSLAQPSQQGPLALTAATNQQVQVPAVPTQAEVSAARVDPVAKKAMAERLQAELDKSSGAIEKIVEQAQNSWDALSDAQQKAIKRQELATTAATQSTAAQKRLKESQKQVGQIASEAYRSGGLNPSVGELLTGDAQKALDRSQTLKTLAESRTRNLKSSESDAALAGQWAKYAEAAKRESERAIKAQSAAEAQAQKEATGYRTSVQAQDSARGQLLARLAVLNGTTVKQEEAALNKRENIKREQALKAAMEAKAAKKAEEEQAARKAAAEKAAAEAAEKDDSAEGLPRPANVPGTDDSSADGQEEGSSAGTKTQAEKDAAAKEAAQAKAEKAAQDKADRAAAKAKAKQQQAEKVAKAKEAAQAKAEKEQAAKDKAAAAAKKKAEEAKDKAEQDQSGEDTTSAEEKAAAEQRAQDKAEAQAKAAKDKAAANKRAAAEAAEKRAEQRQAAKKAAAEAKAHKAAAQKKAQAKAAAKKAAAKKAAAKKAAAKKAAQERAEQAAEDDDNNTPSSSKEAAIKWAVNIGANDYYGYIFGANGPRYFDCSSFALTAFKKSGVSMPRTSSMQFKSAPKHIPLSQLKRGDLVFSSSNGGASMYHVAIYMGNGQVVQARNPNAGISTTPLSWVNNLYPLGARY